MTLCVNQSEGSPVHLCEGPLDVLVTHLQLEVRAERPEIRVRQPHLLGQVGCVDSVEQQLRLGHALLRRNR